MLSKNGRRRTHCHTRSTVCAPPPVFARTGEVCTMGRAGRWRTGCALGHGIPICAPSVGARPCGGMNGGVRRPVGVGCALGRGGMSRAMGSSSHRRMSMLGGQGEVSVHRDDPTDRPWSGNQVRLRAVQCVLHDPLMRLIGCVHHTLAQRAVYVRQFERTSTSTKPHACSLNRKFRCPFWRGRAS